MLALLLLSSCVNPDSGPEFLLAEGGQWTFDPDSLCDTLSCRLDDVDEIVGIYPEVEGVVEVSELSPTLFTLRALTAGDTRVAISGLDSGRDLVERYMQVKVAAVKKFTLGLECDSHEATMDPWVLPAGSEVPVRWNMWDADNNALMARPEFIAEGVVFAEDDPEDRSMVFLVPDEEGEIDVETALTPGPVASLLLVTNESFTDFDAYFWPDSALAIGDSRRIRAAPSVDGDRACIDELDRIATITSPEVCSFKNGESVLEVEGSGEQLSVVADAEGTCSVAISVPELEWTETVSLSVVN